MHFLARFFRSKRRIFELKNHKLINKKSSCDAASFYLAGVFGQAAAGGGGRRFALCVKRKQAYLRALRWPSSFFCEAPG
jgi:hypothetical protein